MISINRRSRPRYTLIRVLLTVLNLEEVAQTGGRVAHAHIEDLEANHLVAVLGRDRPAAQLVAMKGR